MKKGGGKRKGSSFERHIARELSLWWTKGERKDIFWRTHSSGAMGNRYKTETGDIMAIDKLGSPLTERYNIECRHSKTVKVEDLIYGSEKCGIKRFLYEGITHSNGQRQMYFMKENRCEVVIILPYSPVLSEVQALYYGPWSIMLWKEFKNTITPVVLLSDICTLSYDIDTVK